MFKDLRPARSLVLVKLPKETEMLTRDLDSGITVSTLDEVRYHPTHGTMLIPIEKMVEMVENDISHTPTSFGEVYFSKLHWRSAKGAAFTYDNERDKEIETGSDTLAIYEDGIYYMLIPYEYLYMSQIEDKITMLNDFLLCEWVSKSPTELQKVVQVKLENAKQADEVQSIFAQTGTLLFVSDIEAEDYVKNIAKITIGNNQYPAGTIIVTLPHCDIYLEEPLNSPIYKKESFIIEAENIIGIYMENSIKPGTGRIIIKPLAANTEQDNGIVNLAAENMKLQLAEVVSVGEGCASGCKPGDVIIYARGVNQKLPPLPGIDIEMEFIEDTAGNSKVFGIISK